MPGKEHVRGVGSKEQRMYEHIRDSAKKEGRYGKRAEEVAASLEHHEHQEAGPQDGFLVVASSIARRRIASNGLSIRGTPRLVANARPSCVDAPPVMKMTRGSKLGWSAAIRS